MNNMKRKYYTSFLSVIGVGILLVFVLYAAVSNGTLAWFSHNKITDSNGLSVTAQGPVNTEEYLLVDGVRLDDDATDIFSGLVPGDKVSVTLVVRNLTDGAITLRLCLAAPTEDDDTPYITEGGAYCYLGSQIRINSVTDAEDGEHIALSDTERYLLTLGEPQYLAGSLPPTSIPAPYDFSAAVEKQLTDEITIAEGAELLLDIEFEFVDNNTLQNDYINFGSTGAADDKASLRLSRTLLCYYARK